MLQKHVANPQKFTGKDSVISNQKFTVIKQYMAQSLHIGLLEPFTNLPFGICAIYFDSKVTKTCFGTIEPRKTNGLTFHWILAG